MVPEAVLSRALRSAPLAACATLVAAAAGEALAQPLTPRSHVEDYGPKIIEWSYAPSISREGSGTLVQLDGPRIRMLKDEFAGVTGEMQLSNPGGALSRVELRLTDGRTLRIQPSGGRLPAADIPPDRVDSLTLHHEHAGRTWSMAWDVSSMRTARMEGRCARPVGHFTLTHLEMAPGYGGQPDAGDDGPRVVVDAIAPTIVSVSMAMTGEGEAEFESAEVRRPDETRTAAHHLSGRPGVMSATVTFDVCYVRSSRDARGYHFTFSAVPEEPDVVVEGDAPEAALVELRERARTERAALLSALAQPATMTHREYLEISPLGSDEPVPLRVEKTLRFFQQEVRFRFAMRPTRAS